MIGLNLIVLWFGLLLQPEPFDYLPRGPQGEIEPYGEFITCYAEIHEQPYWVAYQLTADELAVPRERKDYFASDPNISTGSATKADYKYSGYDRGHICRASFCKQSLQSYKESFYFSNMSPQRGDVNRSGKVWYRLEEAEADFARTLGSVYSVSGPVFRDNLGTLGSNQVTIPGYFFKAILAPDRSRAIGFLIRHEPSGEDIFRFAQPLDQLESFTGIDFFPALDDATENRIERELDLSYWQTVLTGSAEDLAALAPPEQEATLRLATFNIRVFGKTKAGKPAVMDTLAQIVRNYDLVAVQEIKDASGATPQIFLNKINEDGGSYAMLVSPRTGLQDNDRSSQEQYVYYYNTGTMEPLDQGVLYDDSNGDRFQREPFLARFKAREGNFTFVLASIHTRPEAAVEEIAALHEVVAWARTQYPEEDDFITVGDFNASCNYASPEALDELAIRGEGYVWVVPDDADTNVSTNTACAYDRIVITTATAQDYAGEWGIDNASFTSGAVSDHYPVWAEFYVDRDGD